jgi:hypothetical protein
MEDANRERSNFRRALKGSILIIIHQGRTHYTRRALEVASKLHL